ncbi:MAG TPA: ATP-binding cassette domain-containing protein, partial [Kofleriaceae bacterium]
MSELRAAMKLQRGEFVLDIELVCPTGITCLMGNSGAGKSTILGVLSGLTLPDAGRVSLGDETWLDRAKNVDVPVHERRLSYVFQGLALFPH